MSDASTHGTQHVKNKRNKKKQQDGQHNMSDAPIRLAQKKKTYITLHNKKKEHFCTKKKRVAQKTCITQWCAFFSSQNNAGAFCGCFWAFGHPVVDRSLRAVVFQQSKVG
jgi:hypothetical protein